MRSTPPSGEWPLRARLIVFLLASSSIACLLADLYGLSPMRVFAPCFFLPLFCAMLVYAGFDHLYRDGRVWRAVWTGIFGGLLAAVAYDIFRLPFVFANELGISSFVPPMPLFKVFPRFGAMLLGQPLEQDQYSLAAQALGWVYHFSNGASFGVMYVALVGNPRQKHWTWAVLFALVLELGMLFTPYPGRFDIPVTGRFVAVTVAAHAIFGVVLGWSVRAVQSWRLLHLTRASGMLRQ